MGLFFGCGGTQPPIPTFDRNSGLSRCNLLIYKKILCFRGISSAWIFQSYWEWPRQSSVAGRRAMRDGETATDDDLAATVEALKAGKDTILRNSELTGFGVRVQPSGAKSFIVNFRMGKGGLPQAHGRRPGGRDAARPGAAAGADRSSNAPPAAKIPKRRAMQSWPFQRWKRSSRPTWAPVRTARREPSRPTATR